MEHYITFAEGEQGDEDRATFLQRVGSHWPSTDVYERETNWDKSITLFFRTGGKMDEAKIGEEEFEVFSKLSGVIDWSLNINEQEYEEMLAVPHDFGE